MMVGQEFVRYERDNGDGFASVTVKLYEIVEITDTKYFFRERNFKEVFSTWVHGCSMNEIIFAPGFSGSSILSCDRTEFDSIYKIHKELPNEKYCCNNGMIWGFSHPTTSYMNTYDCWPTEKELENDYTELDKE